MIIGRLSHHSEAVKYPLYSDENTTEEEEWVDENIATKTIWAADFETTTKANLEKDGYVRVYLWSLVSSDLTQEYWGTDIRSFLAKIVELECGIIFFHNLAFDGSFILYYLTSNGFNYEQDYDCVIDDMNNWYQLRIFANGKEIKIWDSLKKFPGQSVKSLAKLYGFPDKKEPPYFERYIPEDYEPYAEEIEYCLQDSRIVANAISKEWDKGHKSLTLSADAFSDVKMSLGGYKNWRKFMPKLDKVIDSVLRQSYKGGWTYCNPKYQNIELENVTVFDVNSLYPYVMRHKELPYGMPECRPPHTNELYIIKFSTSFKLKSGYLPTIQIKNNFRFDETEYLTDSQGEVELCLTNIDFELFKEHYNVYYIKDPIYFSFKKATGLLADYIDYHMAQKIQADNEGNKALRYLSKRYMNSPYGKTGMRPNRINKIPYLDEEEVVRFLTMETVSDSIYVPYASFVCAQARNITIRAAQANYENFIYADTDSIHILGTEAEGIEVHKTKLGAWKNEGFFPRAKYLRAKTYIHGDEQNNIIEIKCAGMPVEVKEKVTWDEFRIGAEFNGKMTKKMVKGGCLLVPTTYKIKEYSPNEL